MLPLSAAEPSLYAASGRSNYGCAPAIPGAHRCTVNRTAKSPLNQGVAMRFGVSTQPHEQTVQRWINTKAKTCKCACTAINLGIYNLDLTHVTMAVSVDRAPAEV
eukprot:6189096-Pleurochrysis_carterae.AAC.1